LPPEVLPDDLPPDGGLGALPPDGALNVLPSEGAFSDLPPEGTPRDLPLEGGLILLRLKIDLDPFLTPGEIKFPFLEAPMPAKVFPWKRSKGSILKTL